MGFTVNSCTSSSLTSGGVSLALLLQHARSNAFAQTIKATTQFAGVTSYLKTLTIINIIDLGVKCFCCDICAVSCDCGTCSDNHSYFEFIGMS